VLTFHFGYYSSQIRLFGVEFIQVYAAEAGRALGPGQIRPADVAMSQLNAARAAPLPDSS